MGERNKGGEGRKESRKFVNSIYWSGPDLPGPDLPEPRFTGRIIFPRNKKLTVFYPDIPDKPDLPGKILSPEHPDKSAWGPTVFSKRNCPCSIMSSF